MKNRYLYLLAAVLTGLFLFGCGSGVDLTSPPPLSDNSRIVAGEEPGHRLWMYQMVLIDPDTLQYEAVPVRMAEGHYNVLKWLEQAPCATCFGISSITPSGTGTLLVDIQVSHPFDNPNLTGFDVRGIPIFNGSQVFPVSGLNTPDRLHGDGELVNADGYTTLYNVSTLGSGPNGLQGYIDGKLASVMPPSATLNGFKRHISSDITNTRNAFFSGGSVTETYEIDPPNGAFVFGYAVDASWAPPINTPVVNPMTDFGPDANCFEPWKLEVTDTPIGDGLTDQGGSTVLTVNVFTHQAGDFTVKVEGPDLFNGEIMTEAKTGSGDGYKTYELTVQNLKLAGGGEYEVLISAINNSNPVTPEWIDLTAYQVYGLHVGGAVQKFSPVAMASANPLTQGVGMPVHFYDGGSYDPDGGALVTYEWDWNNDGVFDESSADTYHTFSTSGVYYVQYRVTDDEAANDILDTPLQITINAAPKYSPVAIAAANPLTQDAGVPVYFCDNGSNDPDGGALVSYEWDWNNDGIFDESGADVYHTFSVDGVYFVQFRVTDDEAATDILDVPLQVTINPVQAGYTWVADVGPILGASCGPCHITNDSGGVQLNTYQNAMNSGVIVPGSPMSSKLYTKIDNGTHFAELNAAELDILYNWILQGAIEN